MRAPKPIKENVKEGNYLATLYRIIYLGTVDGMYKGEETSASQVSLSWELPGLMKVWKDGEQPRPTAVSATYTLSMGKKANLRKIVEGMMGGMTDSEAIDFDVDALLGKSCLLNITYGLSETGNEKQNLVTSALIEGMALPVAHNNQVILSYDNWNEELFKALPDWMREKMSKTLEYQIMRGTYIPTGQTRPLSETGLGGMTEPAGYTGVMGGAQKEVDSAINYNGEAAAAEVANIPF